MPGDGRFWHGYVHVVCGNLGRMYHKGCPDQGEVTFSLEGPLGLGDDASRPTSGRDSLGSLDFYCQSVWGVYSNLPRTKPLLATG